MPGVQKIEDAVLQRVPFILVKLGIVAGVAEIRLVKHRGVRRPVLGTGAIKQVGEAGEIHLRLAVGDRDRGGGVILFRRRARIDRIRLEMRPAIDAEYCPATGVVIGQHRVIPAVDLEFPGAFPDIASRECLGQTEAEYNCSNSKQPWIHRHGEPPTRVSTNILAQAQATKSSKAQALQVERRPQFVTYRVERAEEPCQSADQLSVAQPSCRMVAGRALSEFEQPARGIQERRPASLRENRAATSLARIEPGRDRCPVRLRAGSAMMNSGLMLADAAVRE